MAEKVYQTDTFDYWRQQFNGVVDDVGRMKNDFVTPQKFGAIADGIGDDTPAFEAAENSGKPIYLPPGTYKVSKNFDSMRFFSFGGVVFVGSFKATQAFRLDVTGASTMAFNKQVEGLTPTSNAHIANKSYVDVQVGLEKTAREQSDAAIVESIGQLSDSTYTKAESDSRFLNVSGDTLTGNLIIQKSHPLISLNNTQTETSIKFGLHVSGDNFYVLKDDPDVADASNGWDPTHALELRTSNSEGYVFGNKIWTTGNDGSGSGLDADTLDGHQATHFAADVVPVDGNRWNLGLVKVKHDGVSELGRIIDFHNLDSGGSEYDFRITSTTNAGGNYLYFTAAGASPGEKLIIKENRIEAPDSELSAYSLSGSSRFLTTKEYVDSLIGVTNSNTYTKSESDTRFVNSTGDNLNGTFVIGNASHSLLQARNLSSALIENPGEIPFGGIEVFQPSSGQDAMIRFHIAGDHAVYFGLDSDTNDLAVGGYSWFGNSYRIWHEGNQNLLDARYDNRYDSRYVNVNGDTMTGNLVISKTAPSIELRNTQQGALTSYLLHASANNFYILKDDPAIADAGNGWDPVYALELRTSDNQGYIFGNKIWHTGNDGPGSGLNADLLDGMQASSFALADNVYAKGESDNRFVNVTQASSFALADNVYAKGESDNRFVNATGDTMSGNLSISKDRPLISLNNLQSGYNANFGLHVSGDNFYVLKDAPAVGNDVNGWDPVYALELRTSDSQGYIFGSMVLHEGNMGLFSVDQRKTSQGTWFNNGFLRVDAGGVTELGKVIDFHYDATDTSNDWNYRIEAYDIPAFASYGLKFANNNVTTLDIAGNHVTAPAASVEGYNVPGAGKMLTTKEYVNSVTKVKAYGGFKVSGGELFQTGFFKTSGIDTSLYSKSAEGNYRVYYSSDYPKTGMNKVIIPYIKYNHSAYHAIADVSDSTNDYFTIRTIRHSAGSDREIASYDCEVFFLVLDNFT